ncbi:MAG: flagellin [Smithellaceae bacterium]
MGFRIQNNIEAMNAQRQLGISGSQLTKSLERLSSGYRINKAADDAAGLAISSSFRANIASFKVASRNTSEANSLLQVAEGGMDQITNMLTRLKELATQAASANSGSAERTKINAEGNALISEIDRIANSTKYGSTNLLDGTFGASKSNTTAVGTSLGALVTGAGMIGSTYNSYGFNTVAFSGATVAAIGAGVAEGTWYLEVTSAATTASGYAFLSNAATLSTATVKEKVAWSSSATMAFANLGVTLTWTAAVVITGQAGLTATGISGALTEALTIRRTGLSSLNVENAIATGTFTIAAAAANLLTIGNGTVTQTVSYVANTTMNFDKVGISFALSSTDYADNDLEGMTFTVSSSGSSGSTFQIGAENTADNRIALSIGNVVGTSANGLNLSVDQLTTASNAQTMLTTIDSAISTLGSKRGDIGASMNRLGYAAANLATTIENTQAAESVIRDVDMASEMTTFTKNQILQQAGTAMLSQANQAPQLILSLFK